MSDGFLKRAMDQNRPFGVLPITEDNKLTRLTNELDQIHAELPELLRDPALTERQYEKLQVAYERVSNAMRLMIDAGRIKND